MVDVPRELVRFVRQLLARHRRVLGTRARSRALAPFRQALFGLIWFRDRGVDLRQLAAGFGISRTTGYRYRDEVIAVLAAHAPDLTEALRRVKADGRTHVILDGKIVDTDRYHHKPAPKKATSSTPGTPAKPATSAATSKPSRAPTASPSGSPTSNP